MADNVHGWVDASRHQDQGLESMPWVRRLQHTYLENSDRILVGARDVLVQQVQELEASWQQVLVADEVIRQLADQEFTPIARDRGHGEAHLGQAAVQARVDRANAAGRAVANAELSAARSRRDASLARCGELVAPILEEFSMADAVAQRMRLFYGRRLATYARQLSRRRDDLAPLHFELMAPEWVGGPCPWVSAQIMTRLGLDESPGRGVVRALK